MLLLSARPLSCSSSAFFAIISSAFHLNQLLRLSTPPLSSCPLLQGKDLIGLGAPKGKMLGSVVDELSKWHLLHPDATKQEAEDFIVEYIKTMQ